MKKTIVSALAVLGLSFLATSEAAAQRVRAGASIRLADGIALRWSYGTPYLRGVRIGRDYRHRAVRYWEARLRYHQAHRRHDGRHIRWDNVVREHQALHRDMRRGYVTHRGHHAWHQAVGIGHREFIHEARRHERNRNRGRSRRSRH